MKRNAFTLAEILITLGIVGVVAALTLPSLRMGVGTAQVGPKLAKMVASFEQANQSLMRAESTDSLTERFPTKADYLDALLAHIKGNRVGNIITTKDGISILITGYSANTNRTLPAHQRRISRYGENDPVLTNHGPEVIIDINGINPPNVSGIDIFDFAMYDDGSLRPKGSQNWDGNNGATWNTRCQNLPQHVSNYTFCAGSVMEQGLKVLYEPNNADGENLYNIEQGGATQ
ncbi:MAG: prepilin-type N-terminal cleavage/methylation domain-containing protein [bacterium]|nr:prepilin-type N-terminal cleavage/methylation domain-containing protein [bacterium]